MVSLTKRNLVIVIQAIVLLFAFAFVAASAPITENEKQVEIWYADGDLQDHDNRWAIIIGINDYSDEQIVDLKYAVNDAVEFYRRIVDPKIGNFRADNVFLMVNGAGGELEPTRNNILQAISSIARVRDADTIVFFYSGHGVSGHTGDLKSNYLLPKDALVSIPSRTGIDIDNDVYNIIDAADAKRKLLFIDACRSTLEVNKGVNDRLFEDYQLASGTAVLFSTEFGKASYEDDEEKMGAFAAMLCAGIDGLADGATGVKDGVISFNELEAYTVRELAAWGVRHHLDQIPMKFGEYRLDIPVSRAPGEGHILIEAPEIAKLPTEIKPVPQYCVVEIASSFGGKACIDAADEREFGICTGNKEVPDSFVTIEVEKHFMKAKIDPYCILDSPGEYLLWTLDMFDGEIHKVRFNLDFGDSIKLQINPYGIISALGEDSRGKSIAIEEIPVNPAYCFVELESDFGGSAFIGMTSGSYDYTFNDTRTPYSFTTAEGENSGVEWQKAMRYAILRSGGNFSVWSRDEYSITVHKITLNLRLGDILRLRLSADGAFEVIGDNRMSGDPIETEDVARKTDYCYVMLENHYDGNVYIGDMRGGYDYCFNTLPDAIPFSQESRKGYGANWEKGMSYAVFDAATEFEMWAKDAEDNMTHKVKFSLLPGDLAQFRIDDEGVFEFFGDNRGLERHIEVSEYIWDSDAQPRLTHVIMGSNGQDFSLRIDGEIMFERKRFSAGDALEFPQPIFVTPGEHKILLKYYTGSRGILGMKDEHAEGEFWEVYEKGYTYHFEWKQGYVTIYPVALYYWQKMG